MLRSKTSVTAFASISVALAAGMAPAQGLILGFDPACYGDRLISDTPVPGGDYDRFESDGERAVMVRDDTLLIYDVRDRGHVEQLSSTPLAELRDAAIDLSSDSVYVRIGQREIRVYDISDPRQPQLIQAGENSHDIIFMEAVGGYLYVGDRTERLNVYESQRFQGSTLIQSRVARFNYGPTYYSRVEVDGSVACLVSPSRNSLLVLDIADPANPSIIDTISPPNGTGLRSARVGDGWIAMDYTNGIRLYEISNDLSVDLVTDFQIDDARLAQRIPGRDLLALVQRDRNLYHHLDVSDLGNPTIVKSFDVTREISYRWSNEQVALIDSGSDSLAFIDVRTSDDSSYTDVLIDQPNERFLGLADGLAYVGPTSQFPPYTVRVQDYRTAGASQPFDIIEAQSSPAQVLGTAGVAYIRTDDGVEIYDTADPADISLLSTIQAGEDAFSAMQLRDGLLVVNQGTQLISYDVSDPSSPALLGSANIGMALDEFYFDAGTLVGIDGSMIHTLAYTGPMSVTPLASIVPQTSTGSLAVSNGFIYTSQRLPESSSGSSSGIEVIKIRDPRNPVSTLIPKSDFSVVGMEVIDSELWAFTRRDDDDSTGTIYIYDLADPADPIESRTLDIKPGTPSFGTSDGGVVISDTSSTTVAMDLRGECSYCPADITGEGQLNAIDAQEFVALFTSSDAYADYNFDGDLNYFDVAEYLNAYFGGCP